MASIQSAIVCLNTSKLNRQEFFSSCNGVRRAMYINCFLAWSFYLQVQVRSTIIQQLKDLKVLEETGILTAKQFKEQKENLLKEM